MKYRLSQPCFEFSDFSVSCLAEGSLLEFWPASAQTAPAWGVQLLYHGSGSDFTAISFALHNLLLYKIPLVYHSYLFCKAPRLLSWTAISYLTFSFDHFSIPLLLVSWFCLLECHWGCCWHNFVFVVLGIFQFSWSKVGCVNINIVCRRWDAYYF